MITTSTTVALVDLERDDRINARKTQSDEGIAELKALIRTHGVRQSLAVRPSKETPGKYLIIAGARRYRVLCELMTDGDSAGGIPVTPEFLVPAIISDDDDRTAQEVSQAENFARLPPHEADTYETFRELADRGLSGDQIAARFGIDPKRVKRMLALGRLSPMILDAWREGWFKERAIETVRAFTLASSIEEQERVFLQAKKQGGAQPWTIREAFGAGDRTIGKQLDFVGKDAYLAAGGTIVEDLFDGDHAVSDPALVKKLVAEKLQAKVDEAVAEGWSWASLADDLPSNWSYSWQKLPVSKKKASKDDKAKSGAVVKLSYDFKLEITYGVLKPAAEAKKEKAASETNKEKAAPTISNALAMRLSIQATEATRRALADEPRLGLVALLAGLSCWTSDAPVKARTDGFVLERNREHVSFETLFERFTTFADDQLLRVAAELAGAALDLRCYDAGHQPFRNRAPALSAAIDAGRMGEALRETFDAADYFGAASKPFVIHAIREALNEDEARKADKMKKAELVAFALANVPATGWLPPELRAATYSGPGAKKEPKAKAEPKPKAAKKAKLAEAA